ncbi:8-oxoguanine deaminase [Saccharopolyspora gloriosae]|uniref:Cytosine/adenosine deaminase-related metal-dependent hydrolase n=1 Tax=Saccharopolyspora gloriosae TaxID=455344 RepID=A0A840NEB8_9PSEU|nr:8-oxoguanine deaminase [Saccharopolyspora gloriosae]MBB5067669.1 cytosine/adenosine deaminase-related metal-dependent hydrolase [Saccharopolyspora gloriosae]
MPEPTRFVLDGAAIATVDGAEHAEGHVVVEGDRIVEVAPGRADPSRGERIDVSGCLITPGLVNTHHHLYQWATRGYAPDSPLFDWLTRLYPVWAGLDEDGTHAAAAAGLARLALSGATTVADHHYVFPRDGGDVFGAVVAAAGSIGLRLHAVRGSMDRGRSRGGLPPDSLVEDVDAALAGTDAAISRFHDPSPGSAVRVAVGPCSPFSVSERLMRESAELARARGVRLHTHLAETADEQRQCLAEFGRTPVEHADELGWLGPDVWLAHTVHLAESAIARLAETGTGSAHCPSSNGRLGAGVAPVRALLDAGVPVGLGVDGVASNEAGGLGEEMRQALLTARARYGPEALSVREALFAATLGGARCLGRQDEIGSLRPGKLADLAVWRLDGLGHAGIDDPVAALVLGPLPPLRLLLCGGRGVVQDDLLTSVSEVDLARDLRAASTGIRARFERLHGEVAR